MAGKRLCTIKGSYENCVYQVLSVCRSLCFYVFVFVTMIMVLTVIAVIAIPMYIRIPIHVHICICIYRYIYIYICVIDRLTHRWLDMDRDCKRSYCTLASRLAGVLCPPGKVSAKPVAAGITQCAFSSIFKSMGPWVVTNEVVSRAAMVPCPGSLSGEMPS